MKRQGVRIKAEYLFALLLIGAVLVNVKSIFTDFDTDSEYAIAMSYRMLRGDRMFLEMLEPHQTSAFLCTFFMKLFLMITGGVAGVAIFLQSMGVLFQGLIAALYFFVMKKKTDPWIAFLSGIFFLTVRPKELVLPEFSNMQIWFSVLLFLCLVVYFERQKKIWLVLGGASLCLGIVSYPSCLLIYGIVIWLLVLYSREKVRDCILFSVTCFILGYSYLLFFVVRIGWTPFVQGLFHIIQGDASHQKAGKWSNTGYFMNLDTAVIWILFSVFAAAVTYTLITFFKKEKPQLKKHWKKNLILLFFGYLFITDAIAVLWLREEFAYSIIYLLAVCVAVAGKKLCNEREQKIVVIGLLISFGSFAATMLLTNLDFLSIVRYLILAVMVAFIPAARLLDRYVSSENKLVRLRILFAFCLVMLFRRGVMMKPMSESSYNLLDLGGIVKEGPGAGLVMDYMGAYVENSSVEDWKQYVRPGDRLLITGTGLIATFGYLYEDTVISAPSTICTPTFDENTLEYWERFPEKYPNVVIVPCWYGELKVEEESMLMEWIEQDFQPSSYADGKYWRFYRAEGQP